MDLLESNEEVALSCHNVSVLIDDKISKQFTPKNYEEGIYGLKDFSNNRSSLEFHTSSFVFRSEYYDYSLFEKGKGLWGDFILLANMLKHGKIYYFLESMSVYRKHGGGVTAKKNSIEKDLSFYQKIKSFNPLSPQ